jgi:small-conductance mechanosensitive channel
LKLKQKAVLLLTKTKTGEKIALSQRYRIVFFAAISFAFNLLYALYHCVLGIINLSFWFMVMCAFYGILATMRFSAVLCERNHHNFPSDDTEIFVMKFSGILLVALALVLATVSYISLSQNIAAKHEDIIMITIAAYTFYKIAMAIVKAIKQHTHTSPLLRTIRSISYAEVAASVLTLQRSMLVSFSSMSGRQIYFMNAITGAVVCLFILVLGISMILNPKRKKEYASWQNPKL